VPDKYAAEQLGWLTEAGFHAHAPWVERDLAVVVGDRQVG